MKKLKLMIMTLMMCFAMISFFVINNYRFISNQTNENFKNQEWVLHYQTYDKNYNYQENQRIFLRNDSVISFSELTSEEISFPIIKLDSTIIIKQQITISDKENMNERDTIIIDTMFYDFKYIFNNPILVLKKLNSDYMTVLTCKRENTQIYETNNFLSIINFKIGGLSIGDTIAQNLLINIKDCEDYDGKGLIEANLAENENINLKLINKNIIYSIEQKMLEDDAIENIIKVINKKIKIKIDTIKKNSCFYTEGYRWETTEIEIELSKENMSQYYLDRAEEYAKKGTSFGESMRYTYLELATENITKNKYWTLKYDNILLQNILRYNQKNKTISTIIE